jgi:hypothetical protein
LKGALLVLFGTEFAVQLPNAVYGNLIEKISQAFFRLPGFLRTEMLQACGSPANSLYYVKQGDIEDYGKKKPMRAKFSTDD